MKKFLLFFVAALFGVSAFAGTETTVYYTAPESHIGSYTVKLNVNFKGDGEDWHQFDMALTEKKHGEDPIYSATYTDDYNGVGKIQFQLYDGGDWKSEDVAISEWTGVATYNGKMYAHTEAKWMNVDGSDIGPAKEFFISGDSALVVDAGLDKGKAWNDDAIKSDKDTFALNLKANQDYLLKIVVGGNWLGFDKLTEVADGLQNVSDNHNIGFRLNNAGEVKVIYFEKDGKATFKLMGDFYVAPVDPIKFYVTGDEALVVDAGLTKDKAWKADAIKSEKDTAVLNLKANQDYILKIVVGENWLGYDKLSEVADGLKNVDGDYHNIGFRLNKAGEVKVIYFVKDGKVTFKLMGDFYAPAEDPAKFYVTGDEALVVDAGLDKGKAWKADAIKSEKDTAVLNLKANQDYILKIVVGENWLGFNKLSEVADGLKDLDGDYHNIGFKLNKAGEVKVIYFEKDGKVTFKLMGDFYVPSAEDAAKFYITGDSALVVDAGAGIAKKWNPDAIKSEKDTFVLKLKKEVNYLLKITLDGTWADGKVKGYSALTDKTNMVKGSDDNIGFSLKTDGDVKVIYNATEFKLVGDFVEAETPKLEDGYYLIGQNGWDLASIDAAQKFVETENAGEFKLEVTLIVDKEIKVVEVKDNDIKTWFPDGVDNAYKVDAAHAGKTNIYFKPAGSEDEAWKAFGGFIFVEEGTEPPTPQPFDGKFFITGESLVGSWEPNALAVENGSHTFTALKVGDYTFKITVDGTWSTAKGFSDLKDRPKGVTADGDGNICFSLAEAGDVTVAFDGTNITLTGKFDESKEIAIEDGFYLIGQKGWDLAALSADLKFAAVQGAESEEYKLEVILAEGQKLKVVKVEANMIKTWYPDGMGTDYTVDAAHAGSATIYFRPTAQEAEDWKAFGGFMYIEMSSQAIDNNVVESKAVKFFENGQLIIIKNGVKYNVQGTVVR